MKSKNRPADFIAQISKWNDGHPILAIVLVSLLAVIVNCYPIIFCGRSYVSPMSAGNTLVYDGWPPLPGMEKSRNPNALSSVHGSDTAAMMWWGVPAGFVESRSVWEHGELPLWNRYGHAGDTLIGQAVSMLGDPLQMVVILGRGSAVAWDLKFLAAKFLFCAGFGWLILRLLNSRPLSLIFSALGAYCGAYFYINNHPVFFVFAYAPWILLAAIAWLDLQSAHPVRWGMVWLLANFACFNAGHVEVAVVLIGGLNLAAVSCALIANHSLAGSARVLGRMVVGTIFFVGLTAPVWVSFLVALEGSYNIHAQVEVRQFSPKLLPGAFDDLFYLLLRATDGKKAFAPGTSLLILTGCTFSILRWRQLKGAPFFWVNTSAIVLWGGCVFGWVPAFFLATIPLLNRVGHTDTDFSYLLVIHLTIQCAYGFWCLTKVDRLRQVAGDFACLGGIFAGLFALYFFGQWHQPIPWNYFFCAVAGAVGAPLLFVYLKSRRRQTWMLGWAGIIILGLIPNIRFALYSDDDGNDALFMFPGARTVLNAPSEAINKIKAANSEPFRIVGLEGCLIGDYSSVYELEDIRSCAPLSNGKFINLVRNFPGLMIDGWKIMVVDLAQAQPLLNLLNVRYVLSRPDVTLNGEAGFRVAERSDFGVLENLQAWPRAFFANQFYSAASSEEFMKHLLENGQRPFIALTKEEIEKQPGLRQLKTIEPAILAAATNYRLSPNATEFDVHASSAGVVCLTEGQARDFTATANRAPKEVLTVNCAFKGIYLDQPGDYHVKFTYRPRYWRLACASFWISIGGIMVIALRSRSDVKRKAKKEIAQ